MLVSRLFGKTQTISLREHSALNPDISVPRTAGIPVAYIPAGSAPDIGENTAADSPPPAAAPELQHSNRDRHQPLPPVPHPQLEACVAVHAAARESRPYRAPDPRFRHRRLAGSGCRQSAQRLHQPDRISRHAGAFPPLVRPDQSQLRPLRPTRSRTLKPVAPNGNPRRAPAGSHPGPRRTGGAVRSGTGRAGRHHPAPRARPARTAAATRIPERGDARVSSCRADGRFQLRLRQPRDELAAHTYAVA